MSNDIDIIVNVGHGEYMLDLDPKIVHTVWDPDRESGIAPSNSTIGDLVTDENNLAMWAIFTGLSVDLMPNDVDLSWSTVVRICGDRDVINVAVQRLALELSEKPLGGDDAVFDYWPSGARLARQVAGIVADRDLVEMVESAIQTGLSYLDDDTREQVAGSIDVNALCPAYWLSVKDYVGEAEHEGEIPLTFEAFVDDLRAWVENDDTSGVTETRTPAEWETLTGVHVINADGWRPGSKYGAFEWSVRITRADFDRRVTESTVASGPVE